MIRFVSLVFIFTYSTLLHAADATQTLANLLSKSQSMRANFEQKVFDGRGNVINDSKGEIALERPDKFRWDIKSPMRQNIISNGKLVWDYQPELKQVIIRKADIAINPGPLAILAGSDKALSKNFKVATAGAQRFKLTPKVLSKGINFSEIFITFNGETVKKMRLIDQLGQATEIYFSKIKLNPALHANFFNFSPPKNIDIIRQ